MAAADGCGGYRIAYFLLVTVARVRLYLDHNATTPADAEVVEAVRDAMVFGYGNAASSHATGRAASFRVEQARREVSLLLGVAESRLVWTSGATEALNTAITACVLEYRHLLTGRTEHKAVIDVVEHLESAGATVTWVPVDETGRLMPGAVATAAPHAPFTLVAMAANNETGVLNDIPALAEVVHGRGGRLVCDATQQVGKLPVDLSAWDVDYAAVSAHKLYGPQGVGALVVPSGSWPRPLLRGGGHQRGWRSGTLNVPGIVGFGVAARLAAERLADDAPRLQALRDRLARLLEGRLGPIEINGGAAPRLPNTLNVRICGVDADALIVNCPDVAFSSGSACSSAVPSPSHVLAAMGLPEQHAEESARLSLGRGNNEAEIEHAAEAISEAADRIRQLTRGA